jgi:hypothetical protein
MSTQALKLGLLVMAAIAFVTILPAGRPAA